MTEPNTETPEVRPETTKYPWPFDVFQIFTVLVPGIIVVLLLPHSLVALLASTLVGHAATHETLGWLLYPVGIVGAFVVGSIINSIGMLVRDGAVRLRRGDAAKLIFRSPQIRDALLEALGHPTVRAQIRPKPATAGTSITISAATSYDETTKKADYDESAFAQWVGARRKVLVAHAAQSQTARLFRVTQRNILMECNLAVALAALVAAWLVASTSSASFLPLIPAILLLGSVWIRSSDWWVHAVHAVAGVDLPSFHKTMRLREERERFGDDTYFEQRVATATTVLTSERDELRKKLTDESAAHRAARETANTQTKEDAANVEALSEARELVSKATAAADAADKQLADAADAAKNQLADARSKSHGQAVAERAA